MKPYITITILVLFALGIAACDSLAEIGTDPSNGSSELRTFLVEEPRGPIAVNSVVEIQSTTSDPSSRVSHVELYAVQLPSGQENLLLRADPASFDQTTFTVNQAFVPTQPGYYVIKVVGYNIQGNSAESSSVGFEVQ